MILTLQRDPFRPDGTTGKLAVNGAFFCFTLEPPSETRITDGPVCIPAGEYAVTIDYSPRFGRAMPRVENVPERAGILIHWGNYVEDTEGCVLVGSSRSVIQGAAQEPAVWNSRETFDRLYGEIQDGTVEPGGVMLRVVNAGAGAHEAT